MYGERKEDDEKEEKENKAKERRRLICNNHVKYKKYVSFINCSLQSELLKTAFLLLQALQ